jgi:hypothetical protein
MNSQTLYKKLTIPNFKELQKECLDFFKKNSNLIRKDNKEDYFVHVPFDQFPLLKSFLEPRAKIEINETSVYFVPPYGKSKTHIDGLKKDNGKVPGSMMIAHQYVFILPVCGYKDTVSNWYSNNDVSDNDERIHNHVRKQFPYNFYVSFVKDHIKLNPVGSTNLDCPAFIKSNIYHDVHNNGPETRMAFVIRFKELEYYESLDRVFDTTGL